MSATQIKKTKTKKQKCITTTYGNPITTETLIECHKNLPIQ